MGPERLVKWRELTGLLERSSPDVAQPELTAQQPFAWTDGDGTGHVGSDPAHLNGKRVTQCALSRVCGVCAEPLGRPIAFVGTDDEIARNTLHAPPLHTGCAEALVAAHADTGWRVVTTPHFEFVRPRAEDLDPRPVFAPTSLL